MGPLACFHGHSRVTCEAGRAFGSGTGLVHLKGTTTFANPNQTTRRSVILDLVPQAVASQAAVTPDVLAVADEKETLTYRELDRRAARLADALRAFEGGPDTVVAVCLDRSAAFVVAALGVLQAGAAYLPLDPAAPPDRLAFMLEDAPPHVVVTDSLPPDAVRTDPEALRDWLVAEAITIGFVPTPVAERLIALPWPMWTALRTLLTGADTLHRYPPESLPFTLVNNYGPTECAVVTTSRPVEPKPFGETLPAIGPPIDNAEVLVLDEAL